MVKFSKNLASVEKLIFLIIAFVAFFALIGVSTGCNCTDPYKDSELEVGTANPAAVYCNELGYEYKIINDSVGGQRGVCIFPDNSSCGAWDFFTGKCGQNYSYCGLHGCDIETIRDGKNPYSPEYAVCILPNKTKTSVIKLMDMDKKISVGITPLKTKSINVSEITKEIEDFGVETPTTFDWRNKEGENWMTSVRDQGNCGSCWAFAAVGGVEPKINIARNDSDFDVNLAEQYLVSDCCEDCGDCNGGSSTSALGFIKTQGISDEPCLSYIASDCPCSYRCAAWDKRLWKIDDYDYVPSGRENMKSYLIEKGPLVVSMCMNGHFDANGIYRCDGPPGSYHAVVIVGYDDAEVCWIAKNSWGAGWNGDGYFKVGYGECGIESSPRYIDLTKEQTQDFKADDIRVYPGSKSGELNDTYYKDGDYITLAEKCYTISCDGLYATINLSVETLQNITSIDLVAYHRARWEGGFSLYYWDENSDQWVSLGGIPDSTWHLMKYKLCDSESECASYLSSGNVSVKYYHPSCSFCDTDYVDIDWLYLEAYPEKTYCPASTNIADYEWINRVALNTGERISENSTYSDFTDEVLTTLNRGDTYTLQVDGHTTGGYKEFLKAWIDFNNDKDFIDAGEEINLGNYTFNGNYTFSANFKVPADAVLSDTRMRVYLKYAGEPCPCENASYGEVEDYTVNIISPAVLADEYSDYGEDTDGDGYYNYMAIDVGVNVTEPGYYRISGSLYDELGNYVDYESNYLDSSNQSVTLKFSGIDIRKNGVNGTFNLKHLSICDDSYDELDYRYDAYTTSYYNYTDFEPVPAMFTSGFNDYGEDTNSNALYDYLVVEKEVNVLKAGDYSISGWLYAPNGTSIDYDSNYTTLSVGVHNVTLKFQGWDIYKTGENGNFDVSMYLYYYPPESVAQATTVPEKITVDNQYILIQESIEEKEIAFEIYEERLENKTLEETGLGSSLLDWMENTTSYYSYTEFEPSPAEFNDQYSDSGEDTDGDEYYNYMAIDVGVNATEPGYYGISGRLYDELGNYVDYESNYTYLDRSNQSVTLKFSGIDIRKNGVNGTFNLKHLYLEDENYNEVDYRYDAYTTYYYNYTDFEPVPAEFNNQYSDSGDDTDEDGLYNYLVVEVGVNVTEAGDYRARGYLYDTTGHQIDYESNTTYLSAGNQIVQLKFEGIKIRQNEVNGTFDLKSLYLYDSSTGDQLDYRYGAYTTSYYNYTEFEESILDAYEPDDDPSLANYISVDSTKQTHDFHVSGDHDWLKFNATEGGSYTIETSELGVASDTYLHLYDTDETTEIDYDDDSGIGVASKIVWNCSISGTYYAMVRHYSSSAFGPDTKYNISVTVKEETPNISWNMTISATNQLEPVVVGMHPNATDGYDTEFDVFAETPVQGKVLLILDDIYSTSIKKTRCYNEPVAWGLAVGVPAGQTTTVSWTVPSNVNLTITRGNITLHPGAELTEGSNELLVTAKLIEQITFSLDLNPGWNTASLPLVPDNCSVRAIFGSIPTLETMPVVTWKSPSFVEVEEIEPKIGYWVFTPTDTTINVTGNPINNTTLILEAGWNMVGTVGLDNLTISDIPNQVPQRPAVTWVAPSFVETDAIEPGKSAWVFVTTATSVTVGESVSTEMKAKVVPMVTKMESMVVAATTDEWNLTISAASQSEPVTFGIHPSATDGYDEYDVFSQTPVQGKVIMVLDDIYATEINRDKLIWHLGVGVPAGQTTTLAWDSSKIPADVSLALNGIDMKSQDSMELGEGSHSFVINAEENMPPIANFTFAPLNPVANQTITFNASSSCDPDGNITNYEWDFGDGNITTTTERITTHSYASEGDYNVNLTVTDDDGAINSTSKTITINPLRGDLNHDGNVTSADVLIALRIAVSGEYVPEADIDENSYVNALDARMIMQVAAGRIAL